MAREFDKELTIYIWPNRHHLYPYGHAAYKVNLGNEKKLFNYILDVESRDKLEQLDQKFNSQGLSSKRYRDPEYSSLKQRLQNDVETRNVEHTAPIKVKLPFIGHSVWGLLILRNLSTYEHSNLARSGARSSCGFVAERIESWNANEYVKPPYNTSLAWDPPILERWARAVRARIDELNGKSARMNQICSAHFTLSKQQFATALMSPDEWKALCNQSWGTSLVHSGRRKKLDKLVLEHVTLVRKHHFDGVIPNLAAILDICDEYVSEDYSRGNANHVIPALSLGMNVTKVVETGLERFRFA